MRGGIDNIIDQLKLDEGFRAKAYKDKYGNWTIGYGHLITGSTLADPGILLWTEAQGQEQLIADVGVVNGQLQANLEWVWEIDVVRRGVFQNMCFNVGIHRLMGFVNTIACAKVRDWPGTAHNMLLSKWANQDVPARAVRLAEQIRSGVWQ